MSEPAELTNARLAVNDWHACTTNEELDQWRAAQQRLITAAQTAVRAEQQAEIDRLKAALAACQQERDAARADVAQLNLEITRMGHDLALPGLSEGTEP